eukprot:TRINITY_DN3313_c0_g1::TRINITY_DN3313_c0_g1_i1::g.30983::m.30983 TRINITY_DN3313_c0_g1::TRINITY_DN3313_c0_g1_i1::g.30983  ORF type:complete len:153 (+),score=31.70,sp/O96626/ARPC5_DICDI/32.80/1e-18,P16-Arc/PF04699.9/4e-29,CCDC92/PF14916.1/0.18 TRINITY_DN3313_c0_g1_i1:46-459(+)
MSDDEGDTQVVAPTGPSDDEVLTQLQEKERDVNRYIQGGNTKDALVLSIKEPPYKNGAECKELNYKLVMKAIAAYKDSDFKSVVSELDSEQRDTLMKYVYKGMGNFENCQSLLKLHAALTEDGVGSIVRTLVERQSV